MDGVVSCALLLVLATKASAVKKDVAALGRTNFSVPNATNQTCDTEGKCKCTGDKADCSRNYGSLTFVPKLPNYIRFLNFSYNNLTAIDREDFFLNVTYIECLDLGDNGLRYIHSHAFLVLTRLFKLFLDYNDHLDYPALQPVLSVKTLERLDIRHGTLGPLPTNLFYRFPLPRLQTMYWYENRLGFLNFTDMRPLASLQNIGLSTNRISGIYSDFMPRLEYLVIANNKIDEFLVTCAPNGTSYFPRLTNLFLRDNLLYVLMRSICLPKLKMLQLSGNRFTILYTDMFNSHWFPSLVEVYLKVMRQHIREIQKKAFNNTSLERISLVYNSIKFQDQQKVHAESFVGCPKIRNLALNQNDFSDVDDKRFLQLFGHLTKLVGLFMGNSFVEQVTLNTFANFTNLQRLHMYANKLHTLPEGVFDQNSLEELILRDNRLSIISPLTFGHATVTRLKSLDLSGNLFSCSCELMWFRNWMVAQPSLFANSSGKYTCANRQNVSIMSFYLPEQVCLMNTDSYKFIVASVGLLTFTLMMLSSLYRYRWHIRLVLYETFRDRSGDRRRRLQDQVYNYDVFVSYAEEDLRWVQTRLMPELEQRLALRLCVHQRDFLPGKNIVDNIVDSVSDSKKILMVFSTIALLAVTGVSSSWHSVSAMFWRRAMT